MELLSSTRLFLCVRGKILELSIFFVGVVVNELCNAFTDSYTLKEMHIDSYIVFSFGKRRWRPPNNYLKNIK